MFFPRALLDTDGPTPPSCKPFTIHNNVCVGDLIAIVACSVAGVGFFFWAIHAVRKMRNDPFNNLPEETEEPKVESGGIQPFHVPSLDVHGVPRKLTPPEREQTRLALSQPEEPFYRPSPPIPYDPYNGKGAMTTPRKPPRASGHSKRISSQSHHGSLTRGGPYGQGHESGVNGEYMKSAASSHHGTLARGGPSSEGYEYGLNEESVKRAASRNSSRRGSHTQGGPYGQGCEYGVNDEYLGNVSRSHARVSPARRSSGDYASTETPHRMYAY
ncbi:hypothetical protein OG21DRAFT_1517597 [Imleria badia]|nr:hypothetical protein OG21DRAFT_1517597 [Imleria badia]